MFGDSCKISGSTEICTTVLSSLSRSKSVLNVFQSVRTGMFTLSGLLYSYMFYCTRGYLERHQKVGVPCSGWNQKKFDPLASSA